MAQTDIETIEQLPIKPPSSPKLQKEVVDLVDKIIAIHQNRKVKSANGETEPTQIAREIDRIICKLYGLTEKEIDAIDNSI